jgi:hypothetical protein
MHIIDGRLMANLEKCLADIRTVHSLLEETVDILAYYDSLQVVVAHGDQARARILQRGL